MTVSTNSKVTNVRPRGLVTNAYDDVTNTPFAFPSANLVAHYDGLEASSVTLATGVSNWADLSGNGNDLVQAVGANQPLYDAATGGLTFDGVSDTIATAAFTLNQPETVYVVCNMITWVNNSSIFDGLGAQSGTLRQKTATPSVQIKASTGSALNSDASVGVDVVYGTVFNGISSTIKVNDNTVDAVGDAGVGNMGGFTIGSNGGGLAAWGNVEVFELAVYSVAHDADTQAEIIKGLMNKWRV